MIAIGLAVIVAAAPAAPIRLKYAYAVNQTSQSAKPITDFTGTGTGTMTVTILGRAADGGLRIQAQDWWWNTIRPQQAVNCEAYADGAIACGQTDPLSDAQLTLLPLLAQQFLPGTTRTAHWSIVAAANYGPGSLRSNTFNPCTVNGTVAYKTAPASDDALQVVADGRYDVPCRPAHTVYSKATITYDSAKQLPVLVHNVLSGTTQSVFSSAAIDVKLIDGSPS